MVKTIEIEKFKNIENVRLDLERINVLVGANNSGKSSILQAIQFAVSVAQTTSLEEFRNARWKSNKLSTTLTPNQLIYSPFRDIYSLAKGGSLRQNGSNGIKIKFVTDNPREEVKFLLKKGKNKNLSVEIEGATLGTQIRNIENPFSIFAPGLAGIPAFEELKSEGITRRAAAKGDANNVFRNILWLLKNNANKWGAFTKDFKDVFPNLNIDVQFNKLKDEHLNVYIERGGLHLPIDAYGTGVLQTIQILSYVHLYNPKILILDEPDSHLHPSNQRIIAEKLFELTEKLDFQIILSTHSRHLLDSFSENSKIFWIAEGAINTEDYSFIPVLLSIGALDRGDTLNGNVKCVLLTEDTHSQHLKILLNANGFILNEMDVWSYQSSSKIDIAIMIAAYIRSKAPLTKVLIHRDGDYLSDLERTEILNKARAANIEVFFTDGVCVESHFLSESHLNKIYPELSIGDIQTIITHATATNEADAKRKFIAYRSSAAKAEQARGGPFTDPGTIALNCIAEYDANPAKFRDGKTILGSVRHRLQELHGQRDIFIPTEDLRTADLQDIKNRIWTP